MRILLTADPELPVPPKLYGGIERIVDVLVDGYTNRGHEVTLFAHPDSQVPCRLVKWSGHSSQSWWDTIKNAGMLALHLAAEPYDIVHSFSRLAYLTAILPMGVPKIMSYQREPTISQITKAVRLSRKGSLSFTGCSDYISNQIKPFARATTVYNCVPLDRYDFAPAVEPDAPLIFLGRIEPIKGTHIAVEVAQRTGRRLTIAGNIPPEAKDYFDKQIKPYLNDHIRYVGPVNDAQKNTLLGEAAAFLMPIQWNEPFGIVMAEAMACGTPVLGFPYGAVPEVVEEGVNGALCQDVDQMVQKIDALSTIPRHSVRQSAVARFSNTIICENYLALYQQLAQSIKRISAS